MTEDYKYRLNEAFGELMKWCRGYDYDETIIRQAIELLNAHFMAQPVRMCDNCHNVKLTEAAWQRGHICLDCRRPKAKGAKV